MRKKSLTGVFALVFLLLLSTPDLYAQQQANPPAQGWYCPYRQMGMGQGMHRGGGPGRCFRGQRAAYNRQGQPVTMERAKQMLEDYVSYKYNPNLKIGDISDKGDIFEASILTMDGSPVERIQVDKKSGWFRNAS